MLLTEQEAVDKAAELCKELDKRAKAFDKLELYVTGECPLPPAISTARVTKAYRMLMAYAQTNYGRLIVKTATSRLQVGGIRTGDEELDRVLWQVWQKNRMDGESKRGHDVALTHGRAFGIVWPREDRLEPEITLEDPSSVIVEYREGSRYERSAALRRWVDKDGVPHCTLYTADALYKFSAPKNGFRTVSTGWKPRDVPNEAWPLSHDFGVVPVVELAVNRKLKSGDTFGIAAGDFEATIGLLDRINILEFLRLVIAFSAGFPIRAVIGDKILRDDNNEPIAPYELAADVIAQFEDPNTKLTEIPAADVKGFGDAIDHDVETLAGITQTPSYYMRSVPIQNVSADAIIASDAPLNARVEDHKPDLSEGHEELFRVAGLMLPEPIEVPAGAEVFWVNREARSLAARADAAQKLKDVMPWQFIASDVFQLGQTEIARLEAMKSAEQLLLPDQPVQ